MKKKLLLIVMALVLVASCALGLAACNSGDIKGKFELSSDGTYYICTGASWYSHDGDTEVVDNTFEIPSEYDGKPVKRIAEKAFRASRIGTIIIPNSVTYIGEEAFSGAKATKITFGDYSDAELSTHDDSIQPYSIYMGKWAFRDCDGLKEIEIPANAYLEGNVFNMSENLEKVTFAGNIAVKVDGSYILNAFDSSSIKSIILPEATETYRVGIGGLVRTSLNNNEEFKDFTMPLQWVVVPENVTFTKDSWENEQIDMRYSVLPPIIYYKGTSGYPEGANPLATCKNDHNSNGDTRSFGSFIYNYSETSQSGNYWHFVDGVPTKW